MSWKFWKRGKDQADPAWSDPLDPHGDGTLRPGDPVFDAMMSGKAIHGNFGPQGWEFEEYDTHAPEQDTHDDLHRD